MKTGKTLTELAREVERINSSKKDFLVPVSKLEAIEDNGKVKLNFQNGITHSYGSTPWAIGQLAQLNEIPKAYLDRLTVENPKLAATNINHGFSKRQKETQLIRTLDGNARAILSNRYRILDAHDMLEAVLPVVMANNMEVISSEVTDKRLFIKALSPKLQSEVKKGDVVQYGLTISTSDVGAGSIRVEPLIYRLICLNGMISDTAFRKYHTGRSQIDSDVQEIISDKTRELSDKAFWATVRDLVLHSLKPENFERQVDKLRVAANEEIKNFDLPRVVELTMNAVKLSGEDKKNSILAALASGNEGAGLTKWGLINSITRAAQDDRFDYETSIEMERAASHVLELPRTSWEHISAVA